MLQRFENKDTTIEIQLTLTKYCDKLRRYHSKVVTLIRLILNLNDLYMQGSLKQLVYPGTLLARYFINLVSDTLWQQH